ncbi:MAG: gamma-glutamyltransferase [Pseudomonadota bacterium]
MARFAVACGHERTAETAENVLNEGGTAADAAVAAAMMAMVAEPILAGLLGGGFAMVVDEGETKLLDFFVQTPKNRTDDIDFRSVYADFGATRQEFHVGAGSIATPGAAPGLVELHARAGRIPFRELVKPAIEAARAGIAINAYQARLGQIIAPILTASDAARQLMCDDAGPLPEAATYTNPAFADVLEVFAIEGTRFVTEGEVAAALVALGRDGGHLSDVDLRRYQPIWRAPHVSRRGGVTLALNPPPSLGGILIDLSLALSETRATALSLARAFDAVDRARKESGDDVAALLAPDLVERYRKNLAEHPVSSRGTTHISVVDAQGMAVALTLSNGEGCGLIAPGTGIMPNNMLGEEDLVPGGWHSWAKDTRLASMMCPLAMHWPDGRLAMLGSGGSNRIRTALAQVILHMIDRAWPIDAAIDAARLHVEAGILDVELPGLADADRTVLAAAYPEAAFWEVPSMFFGGVHGVMRDRKGACWAAADARRAGVALPAAHSVAV